MKTNPRPLAGACIVGFTSLVAHASAFTPTTPPQIISPADGESVPTTSPLSITVDPGDLPDVQTVEIFSNGTRIGWADTPDLFGEWAFPGDAHLSVMDADPQWSQVPVIMDFHPDGTSPMVFFSGEFTTPTRFTGTYEINSWPNPPTGNVTIDFLRQDGLLSVEIVGDGTLGTKSISGGVEVFHDENYTLVWDPPAGSHDLTARVNFIDPTTMDDVSITTGPVAINATPPAAPDISIADPAIGDLISGQGTVLLPAVAPGSSSPETILTIRNDGNAPLMNIAITMDGANASDFQISGPADSTLAPGETTTIGVTFQPSASGARTARISVASNDPDENPFLVELAGNAVSKPKIVIQDDGGNVLVSGSAKIALPKTGLREKSKATTFVIRNVGSEDLQKIGISLAGKHSKDFKLIPPRTNSVPVGGTSKFKVIFKPREKGKRIARMSITSNDPDVNPFVIDLVGKATTAPEIDVRQTSRLVHKKSTVRFGRIINRSKGKPHVFTIQNTGTADLKNLRALVTGSNKKEFQLKQLRTSKLEPGKSASFTIRFKPKKTGKRKALLKIISNDTDENPFKVKLVGNSRLGPIRN